MTRFAHINLISHPALTESRDADAWVEIFSRCEETSWNWNRQIQIYWS
jgi:hypothetical protein